MATLTRIGNPNLTSQGFDEFGNRQVVPNDSDLEITQTQQTFPDLSLSDQKIDSLSVSKLAAGSIQVSTFIQSPNYVAGTTGWRIDGLGNAQFNSLVLVGGTISYGKTTFSDSVHAGYYISSSGIYFGDAADATYIKYDIAGATFNVKAAINTTAGSALNGTYLTANSVTSSKVNAAIQGWNMTNVFSSVSATQVNWGAGTLTLGDGTAFAIGAGNTGAMAAQTYIYLDTAVSVTAFQITTTSSTAVGDGKILVATASNNTNGATFVTFGGNGATSIDGSKIVPLSVTASQIAANTITAGQIAANTITASQIAASTITGNEIAANTITANKLSVASLSAISADLGTITAGTITISTSGFVRGGQTDYNTGTGFFLGYSGGAYKFSIGDTTTSNSLTWDGTTMRVNGSTVSNYDIYGSGFDGDVTLGSDTTLSRDMYYNNLTMPSTFNLNANGYRVFVKNTLTRSGTGKIYNNGGDGGNGTDGTALAAGTGGSAGAAAPGNTVPAGLVGKTGANGVYVSGAGAQTPGNTGTNGTNNTETISASNGVGGGAGGRGNNSGANDGGPSTSGGTATQSTYLPRSVPTANFMYTKNLTVTVTPPNAGSGSGSSGGVGTNAAAGSGGGGGSGGSGGILFVAARNIVDTGSGVMFEAKGGKGGNAGNGFNGSNGVGGSGGGGGGNGGILILTYTSTIGSWTTSVLGGLGGNKSLANGSSATKTDGQDGTQGNPGEYIQLVV